MCGHAQSTDIAHLLEWEGRLSGASAHPAPRPALLLLLWRLLAGAQQRRQVRRTAALRLLILQCTTLKCPGAAAAHDVVFE